jgi:signal peptidase I
VRTAGGGLLRSLVAAIIAALAVNTWGVDGLFAPLVVASGSMAPALLGPHVEWNCLSCGLGFCCGLESLPGAGRGSICPHCGAANDVVSGTRKRGDRVLVDRVTFLWRAPKRFEMVVAQNPDDPRSLCVKRVVGLPGETVCIADGEVWHDGQIARKSSRDQRDMAVVVDRPSGPIADTIDSRWHDQRGAWRQSAGEWRHDETRSTIAPDHNPGGSDTEPPIDWLSYHHVAVDGRGRGVGESEVLDDSAYDQTESRRLNPVGDVVVRGRITAGHRGELLFRASDGERTFVARLNLASRTGELFHADKQVATIDASDAAWGLKAPFEWGTVDRQLQLIVGGRTLVEFAFQPSCADRQQRETLAIGVRGAELRLSEMHVLRDVYYVAADGARPSRLAAGEYYLLGDNSAHSRDSRHWPSRGAIPAEWIVGRAIHW